jgi:hypothetical protein
MPTSASLDQFFRKTPRRESPTMPPVFWFSVVRRIWNWWHGEGALSSALDQSVLQSGLGVVRLQKGQARTIIIMFMTPSALAGFNRTAVGKSASMDR